MLARQSFSKGGVNGELLRDIHEYAHSNKTMTLYQTLVTGTYAYAPGNR